MRNAINEIRENLNRVETSFNYRKRLLFSQKFQLILIDRFIKAGARYNSDFVDNGQAKGEYKKFFAFKENDSSKLTTLEILERVNRIERLLKKEISESGMTLEQIEFNVDNLENLMGGPSFFGDLIRGTFLWRAVQDE